MTVRLRLGELSCGWSLLWLKNTALNQQQSVLLKGACLQIFGRRGTGLTTISTCYFLAADYQLAKKRDSVSLADVQARLCQCLWLLSQSRINHCWDLFGTAARQALAIGLHRKRRPDAGHDLQAVERECRRRTFWNAYCLDNYLSIALGRPRIFHDDDIDQEMPSTLDDTQISNITGLSQSGNAQSSMLAPVAYFKCAIHVLEQTSSVADLDCCRLSRVVAMILRDFYSIRPTSTAERCALTTKYSHNLKMWRSEIPRFLDADDFDVSVLTPIFRRQRNVLNLSYWHTLILLNRHFLLGNFAHLQQDPRSRRESPHKAQIEQGVGECLQAAMNIVGRVTDMIQSGQMFKSFWVMRLEHGLQVALTC